MTLSLEIRTKSKDMGSSKKKIEYSREENQANIEKYLTHDQDFFNKNKNHIIKEKINERLRLLKKRENFAY